MTAIAITTAWRVRISVRLDAAVNDPQGNTVRSGLAAIGYDDARDVRVGRIIELTIDAAGPEDARARAQAMCRDLLANPNTEAFEIEVTEAA